MSLEGTVKTKYIYIVLKKSLERPLEKPLDHKGQQDNNENCSNFTLVTYQLRCKWSATWGLEQIKYTSKYSLVHL